MQPEKKYEQWKAITESDFVTLFIKTWFTFIAVLRELNRDVDVFTADGAPRGDKPFLNAYKEGIMPIVQKRIDATILAQELFKMYPISMRKVMDVFPQYFFQTFFQIANFVRTVRTFRFGRCEFFGSSGVVISDKRCVRFLCMIQSFKQPLLRERSIIFNAKQHNHSWHHRDATAGHLLR